MGIKQYYCEVVSVGFASPDNARKGLMFHLYHYGHYAGFNCWMCVPDACKEEMMTIALASISDATRVIVGLEEPSRTDDNRHQQPEEFSEIKSLVVYNSNARPDSKKMPLN